MPAIHSRAVSACPCREEGCRFLAITQSRVKDLTLLPCPRPILQHRGIAHLLHQLRERLGALLRLVEQAPQRRDLACGGRGLVVGRGDLGVAGREALAQLGGVAQRRRSPRLRLRRDGGRVKRLGWQRQWRWSGVAGWGGCARTRARVVVMLWL